MSFLWHVGEMTRTECSFNHLPFTCFLFRLLTRWVDTSLKFALLVRNKLTQYNCFYRITKWIQTDIFFFFAVKRNIVFRENNLAVTTLSKQISESRTWGSFKYSISLRSGMNKKPCVKRALKLWLTQNWGNESARQSCCSKLTLFHDLIHLFPKLRELVINCVSVTALPLSRSSHFVMFLSKVLWQRQ